MQEGNFDFKSVTEEPEDLDFSNLVPCPHCKKPIPRDALNCLYCGRSVDVYNKPLWLIWTAVLLIVIFIVFFLIYM